jgi:hypothetical protein
VVISSSSGGVEGVARPGPAAWAAVGNFLLQPRAEVVLLPLVGVVLRVGENVSDEHPPRRVVDDSDEPVVVAADVEHDLVADKIGRVEGSSDGRR